MSYPKQSNWKRKQTAPPPKPKKVRKREPLATEEQKQSMQIAELSYDFAKRIVYLHQYLTEESDDREFKMADQVYRSGTSVGANVRESNHAQSAPDFLSKMQIALKEADEPKEQREPLEARLPMAESRLRKTIVKLSTGSHFFMQVIT